MSNREIIYKIAELVIELIENNKPKEKAAPPDKIKMLTIEECMKLTGLSKNTIRQLIFQGKVKSIRAGEGSNGKYLVNKRSLYGHLNGGGGDGIGKEEE